MEEQIRVQIAALTAQRAALVQEANQRIAYLNGAIEALSALQAEFTGANKQDHTTVT